MPEIEASTKGGHIPSNRSIAQLKPLQVQMAREDFDVACDFDAPTQHQLHQGTRLRKRSNVTAHKCVIQGNLDNVLHPREQGNVSTDPPREWFWGRVLDLML